MKLSAGNLFEVCCRELVRSVLHTNSVVWSVIEEHCVECVAGRLCEVHHRELCEMFWRELV